LKPFLDFKYIRLETVRKNGKIVATSVWFVEFDEKIFVRSYANSGKVKRMRKNPQVWVTPADVMGHPKGDPLEGVARFVDALTAVRVSRLLYRKYGLMKVYFDLWGAVKQQDWAVVSIHI
jgi:PPOX class probable F420-dependent enzyme